MKAKFVSDIHIFGPEDPRLKKFENFLAGLLCDGTTHLFLVGDIFDLWVGSNSFFRERYSGVIDLIRRLRAQNIEVIYFEGNHDLHIQRLWADELNCRVVTEPQYFDIATFRVRVEHGDQMNPDDTGYLVLRSVLRTGFIKWLADALPGYVIQSIGNKMSRSSRKWTSSSLKARDETRIKSMIRDHAKKVRIEAEPFDILVSGHVHVRDDFSWKDESSGKNVRSVNLGWWPPSANTSTSIFCIDSDGGRWLELS